MYSRYFTDHEPARAAFQVAALPKQANIEIEAVALIGEFLWDAAWNLQIFSIFSSLPSNETYL